MIIIFNTSFSGYNDWRIKNLSKCEKTEKLEDIVSKVEMKLISGLGKNGNDIFSDY